MNDGTGNTVRVLDDLTPLRQRGVAPLVSHARRLMGMTQQLATVLPERLVPYCRVANVRDTTLVLQADSPAWAALLRCHGPAILEHLQRNGWPELHETKFIVEKPETGPAPTLPPATMSCATVELLRKTASSCTDEALRAAWERLARHSCKP